MKRDSASWMSSAYPSRVRCWMCEMIASAWRAKRSTCVMRSRLKKGRVMARWNFHISPSLLKTPTPRTSKHCSMKCFPGRCRSLSALHRTESDMKAILTFYELGKLCGKYLLGSYSFSYYLNAEPKLHNTLTCSGSFVKMPSVQRTLNLNVCPSSSTIDQNG